MCIILAWKAFYQEYPRIIGKLRFPVENRSRVKGCEEISNKNFPLIEKESIEVLLAVIALTREPRGRSSSLAIFESIKLDSAPVSNRAQVSRLFNGPWMLILTTGYLKSPLRARS